MASPSVGTAVQRAVFIGDESFVWSEVTITFDGTSDPCSLTVNATNFPALGLIGDRMPWLWCFKAYNTSATDTIVPFITANTTERVATLEPSSAANGHCTTGGFERAPIPVRVALGGTLTVDKGETGSAGACTVTIGLGPAGDM